MNEVAAISDMHTVDWTKGNQDWRQVAHLLIWTYTGDFGPALEAAFRQARNAAHCGEALPANAAFRSLFSHPAMWAMLQGA